MSQDLNMIPESYEVLHREYIPDVESDAFLLRHKKTGARVAVLSNQDENKVFNIAFRTPPHNSTGVAHITEHSVLCGSRKYPAKDPFIELVKGSLNTFLNAMTFPDKTTYPVASCNDVDFRNLMDVYLDAVFYPNTYIHDEIFRQEGWHYELDDKDGELSYNGVVYNEMKGAFSSPEEVLYRKISQSLFPDTTYSVESGGDPDVIPQLSYEEFLDFHRKYYHPSNSWIYLYGDMDVRERLEYLDREYLSAFDDEPVDSAVALQKPFDEVHFLQEDYPADSDDSGTYFSCSWTLGENGDVRKYLAFQILEYLLMEAPGAPLKQALLEGGFGEDVFGNFETSVRQPYLSIIVKNMDGKDKDRILSVIRTELEKLADGGLSRRSIEGAVNAMEFKAREADFGRWPKGLMYGLQMMDSWIYDENKPFEYLRYQKAFDFFHENLDSGYFEGLIRRYLLENTHASVVILAPKKGLQAEHEKHLARKLADYKASLTDDEVEKLVRNTAELKAYQSEPTPPEVLEKIPLLEISDIRRNSEPLYNTEIPEDGFLTVLHDLDSNQIAYVSLLFDLHHIREEDMPYLGILAEVMGEMNTTKYTYQELTDEINLSTGGLKTNVVFFSKGNAHDYEVKFQLGGKSLYTKMPQLFDIMESIATGTDYSDTARLKEILNQIKSRLEMSLMSAGHAAAVSRAMSCYCEANWLKEQTEGIEFYRFLCDLLAHYDERAKQLSRKLEQLTHVIIRRDLLTVDWTGDRAGYEQGRRLLCDFAGRMFDTAGRAGAAAGSLEEEAGYPLDADGAFRRASAGTNPVKREAFTTPGMVQFDAVAGDFMDAGFAYSGAMNVLRNILSNEFLWNEIRVKGGAYGCMCSFSPMGDGYFTSYRDPNLAKTYDTYHAVADYLRHFSLDEREMRKYIIGAFGVNDTPMTVSMKGARSMAAYMSGRTIEQMQHARDQMLAVTEEDIRSFAGAAESIADSGCICVIGSESAIMKEKERFDKIGPLLSATRSE